MVRRPETNALIVGEVAAAYLPVVRGFLLGTSLYYGVISVSHLFYETGAHLLVLAGLAVVTATAAGALWLAWGRKPPKMPAMEAGTAAINALFLANVTAYLTIHFEPLKLFYFVLLALAFATAAPTRRLAYGSVAAAGVGMLAIGRHAPGDLVNQYAFVGFAGGFAAVGMATLMRGAVLRELNARLASEALNRTLTAELETNERLRATAQSLAAAAQAASRAKSEFLATISHEIRTPLNGVMGMAQLMERDGLGGQQRERLEVIQSSASTLLDMVNAVLDISKIEAGQMSLSPTVFNVRSFVDVTEHLYGPLAREKGLALSIEVAADALGWRHGDEVRLRQVLSNLLSNALKFTESGSISVLIAGDAERLEVSVCDTGPGVRPEERDRIFEPFVQADATTTRRVGGVGLGLAICREIVGLLGGAITVEAASGGGARFAFHVDFPAAEPPADSSPAPARLAGATEDGALRLLVVDDNGTNRTVLQALLVSLGAAVETATQGREAVAAWEAGGWDAILMDIHMPEMDGLEASRIIRERERATGRQRTPVIAVTASVLAHETQGYLEAGMDCVVAKPVALQNLVEALQACLTPPPDHAEAHVRASAAMGRP